MHGLITNFVYVVVVGSDRNTGGSDRNTGSSDRNTGSRDVSRCTQEVLHRVVQLLPHRCVSRPRVCSQILEGLTVLQEMFRRYRRYAAVAHSKMAKAERMEGNISDLGRWSSRPKPCRAAQRGEDYSRKN